MERSALRPGRVLLVAAVILLTVLGVRWLVGGGTGFEAVAGTGPAVIVRAPEGVRIRVEVLNASRIRGLARRATQQLRDGGFDVVYAGNSRLAQDSTLVLDRSGHPEWAQLVARALGGARVEARPDSSRYLDVTVILGSRWRPAAQPLRP